MRTVRCVSPHGGAHHGLDHDDRAVPPGYSGPLKLEPNEGGWVDNAYLGYVAVGAEVDAPEAPEFIADGFHFVAAATGQGDQCTAEGDACWCGGQYHQADEADGIETDPDPADVRSVPAAITPASVADLLGNGAN
jgi:hypothetical protein